MEIVRSEPECHFFFLAFTAILRNRVESEADDLGIEMIPMILTEWLSFLLWPGLEECQRWLTASSFSISMNTDVCYQSYHLYTSMIEPSTFRNYIDLFLSRKLELHSMDFSSSEIH